MSEKKPVIVYGASGYTGRLVCEYLREYNIPFIAAGRSAEKLNAAMKSNVAGIETADYEVVTVPHTVAALTELFKGASVVLNTVGPFAKFGVEVVQACLAAKCHYTDPTGEQDWLNTLEQEFGTKFGNAGLLLAPGIAQMYTTGEIAAQLCLETPGLDTLDIAVFWGGSPTIASTPSVRCRKASRRFTPPCSSPTSVAWSKVRVRVKGSVTPSSATFARSMRSCSSCGHLATTTSPGRRIPSNTCVWSRSSWHSPISRVPRRPETRPSACSRATPR